MFHKQLKLHLGPCVCMRDSGFTSPSESRKNLAFWNNFIQKVIEIFKMIWSGPPGYHKPAGVCKTAV